MAKANKNLKDRMGEETKGGGDGTSPRPETTQQLESVVRQMELQLSKFADKVGGGFDDVSRRLAAIDSGLSMMEKRISVLEKDRAIKSPNKQDNVTQEMKDVGTLTETDTKTYTININIPK